METKLEILKAKKLRADILESLYKLYPQAVAAGTVRRLLRYKDYNPETEIRKAIFYLEGKGYITFEGNEEDYWDSEVVLTPLGINLAEGDAEDVGVSLDA